MDLLVDVLDRSSKVHEVEIVAVSDGKRVVEKIYLSLFFTVNVDPVERRHPEDRIGHRYVPVLYGITEADILETRVEDELLVMYRQDGVFERAEPGRVVVYGIDVVDHRGKRFGHAKRARPHADFEEIRARCSYRFGRIRGYGPERDRQNQCAEKKFPLVYQHKNGTESNYTAFGRFRHQYTVLFEYYTVKTTY